MNGKILRRGTIGAAGVVAIAAGVAYGVGALRTENSTLTAGDAADGDRLGNAVAVSGDTVVIGASAKDTSAGAAYVFTKAGAAWTQQAKLTTAHPFGERRFGTSVAIDGDRTIVGIPGPAFSAGSAEVFLRTGTVWTEEAELFSPDGALFDQFGSSVAIAGDTAVIGARNTGSAKGAARVFKRSGTAWAQEAKLTDPAGATFDYFGTSVAISGDTVAVGVVGKESERGAVFIFTRSGTTWTQQALIQLPVAPGDPPAFGLAVALAGDTLLASASRENAQSGAAYVFTRSGTTWSQQARLTPADPRVAVSFGVSLALSGDVAVVGCPGRGGDGIGSPGSAYVFTRTGTSWTQSEKLLASDGANGDGVGFAVAVASGTVVAGASSRDQSRGAAYVFDLDVPAPERPGYCRVTKVKAKTNAAHPERSTLTASGTLESGASAANYDRPATFDVGLFHLDIPAFVRKGASLTYSAGGISLKLTPEKNGLSRAAFSVKVVGDLTGKVDLAAPVAFNFTNDLYDLDGSADAAAGPPRLVTPGLVVLGVKSKIKGGGQDTLAMTLGTVTDGVAPDSPEDLTICFGTAYTSPLIAAESFVRKGEKYVYSAKGPGLTKVIVDHAKGLITVAGTGLDLGPIGPGGNLVDVAIVRRSETQTARVHLRLVGTKLTY